MQKTKLVKLLIVGCMSIACILFCTAIVQTFVLKDLQRKNQNLQTEYAQLEKNITETDEILDYAFTDENCDEYEESFLKDYFHEKGYGEDDDVKYKP